MKTIGEFINESMPQWFEVAFNGFVDKEGLPVGVTILVDREYAKAFDKFLEKEEGGIFAHADGGETEY